MNLLRKRPLASLLILGTLLAHLWLIKVWWSQPKTLQLNAAPKRIAVQQVKLKPPPPKPAPKPVAVAPKPKPKPKPVAQSKPKPKPKPQAKPKPKPEKREVAKPEPKVDKRREELLAQVRKQLEKVEDVGSQAASSSSSAPAVRQVKELDPSVRVSASEAAYASTLIQTLRTQLRLPDVGDVEVRLTLASDGRVLKLEILDSQSERNRRYIEQSIPNLSFAPFDGRFGGAASHDFSLTLANE